MGEASYQNIQLLIDEGLATLTLDRPNRLNSFNAKMHWEVKEAFEQIKIDNSIRCLLITGSGKGFCAGQDLSARQLDTSAEMPDLAKSIEMPARLVRYLLETSWIFIRDLLITC